jgi:hypothetical protein
MPFGHFRVRLDSGARESPVNTCATSDGVNSYSSVSHCAIFAVAVRNASSTDPLSPMAITWVADSTLGLRGDSSPCCASAVPSCDRICDDPAVDDLGLVRAPAVDSLDRLYRRLVDYPSGAVGSWFSGSQCQRDRAHEARPPARDGRALSVGPASALHDGHHSVCCARPDESQLVCSVHDSGRCAIHPTARDSGRGARVGGKVRGPISVVHGQDWPVVAASV